MLSKKVGGGMSYLHQPFVMALTRKRHSNGGSKVGSSVSIKSPYLQKEVAAHFD